MEKVVTSSFYIDIEDLSDIIICGRTIPQMLKQWDEALGIEVRVYKNLVRVFYSNIELSVTEKDRVVTHVGSVRIEFDVFKLSSILGIFNEGLYLYTSRKELHFSQFTHFERVRNICRWHDIFNEVCSLSFRS